MRPQDPQSRKTQGLEHRVAEWFTKHGGYAAHMTDSAGTTEPTNWVTLEKVLDICMQENPDWDRDIVSVELEKLKLGRVHLRVKKGSKLDI